MNLLRRTFIFAFVLLLITDGAILIRSFGIRQVALLGFSAIFCAAVAEFLSLLRWLPIQNVIFCGGLIVGTAELYVLFLMAQESFGYWFEPVAWISVILSSRGTARFCLQEFRGERFYAITSITFSFILSVLAFAGLHLFLLDISARKSTAALALAAPMMLVVLLLISPWLIDKRGVQSPRDWQSLFVWILLVAHSIVAAACRFQ